MTIDQIEESSVLRTVNHPWRRYFARGLDYSIYTVLWSAIAYLALRMNPSVNLLERFILTLIPYGMMLLLEPILLATLGTTPGKWIFGLVIRGTDGRKLTLSAAWNRTCLLFVYGEGFCIPFYNLYRNYQSYKTCSDKGELPWDAEIAYTIRDTKIWRILVFLAANILLLAVTFFIALQAEMPRHRGDLSAKEFTQNFNDMLDYKGIDFDKHLDARGKWTEDPQDGSYVLDLGLPLPDFEITETNGVVTKVLFEVTTDRQETITGNFTTAITLAVKSYVCAQQGINFLNQMTVLPSGQTAFTDFEFTKAGITVICHVTYEGYNLMSQYGLFPKENEKQHFHLEFSMEKTA